ncbi:MAG: mechanosensitive ion channel family protein, partial [Thermodesulfobacteriota bacterium]|nr:mechanosensitive ion channel family protein [Thermodesulfobacteriota bacterium]
LWFPLWSGQLRHPLDHQFQCDLQWKRNGRLTIMGTIVLEIGPGTKSHQYTGRAIFIPNSKFLSHPVINETYMEDYIFHIITIPLKGGSDWQKAEKALLNASMAVCDPYMEKARKHMKNLESKHSLDAPGVDPRVHIQIPEPDHIKLVLRVPVPARRKGRMEQAIMRQYLLNLKEMEAEEEKL